MKHGHRSAYSRADAKYVVTVAHQAFAIAEALDQARGLEEARDALLRSSPKAGAVAPDTVEIGAIDLLRDATMPVYELFRAHR